MTPSENPSQRAIAPAEPEFIRPLPGGVEYTHIKSIFMALPSPLTTALWASGSSGERLVTAFNGRTVRAIDRALRRLPIDDPKAAAVRGALVQLCLYEANAASSPHPGHRIRVTHVLPHLFDEKHRPPGPSVPYTRISVAKGDQQPPTILDERVIVSQPAPWDPALPFTDTCAVHQAILDLVRRHFPRLMGVRVSKRWRSNYPPQGWKLITQHVVPALYEYLRPFYPVRRYRRRHGEGPGAYPVRLREDIKDIIRFEFPLARGITVARLTAAIQRHIAREHRTHQRTSRKRRKQ